MPETESTAVGNKYECPLSGNIQKRYSRCPYLEAASQVSGRCKVSGGTTQSGYDYERYCLTATGYLNCANYQGRVKSMYP
jgi:hypothetical protein